MSQRTDHTHRISEMRESARLFQQTYETIGSTTAHDLALSLKAAADLLEMHDATGINLHNAPGLLAFVEFHMEGQVDPNGA